MRVLVVTGAGIRYKGRLYKKGEEFNFLNEEEAQKLIQQKYLKKIIDDENKENNEEEDNNFGTPEIEDDENQEKDFESPEIEKTKKMEEEMNKWDEITLNYYNQYSEEEKEEFWKQNKKQRDKIKKQAHDSQEE